MVVMVAVGRTDGELVRLAERTSGKFAGDARLTGATTSSALWFQSGLTRGGVVVAEEEDDVFVSEVHV